MVKPIARIVKLPLNYFNELDRAIMDNILFHIEDGIWECNAAENIFRESFELYSDEKTGEMSIVLYDIHFGTNWLFTWNMTNDKYLFAKLAEYIYRIANEYFNSSEYQRDKDNITDWENITEDYQLTCSLMDVRASRKEKCVWKRYMYLGEMKHYYNLFKKYSRLGN